MPAVSTPNEQQPTPAGAAWRQVRAVLVALHCIAVISMAMPAPGGALRRSAWQDPTVQGEFEAWTDRLNALGAGITKDELEDALWEITKTWLSARSTALAPFQPYYKYAGTVQSWRMFVAPHRYPTRIEVAVREADEWRTVYVARSNEYTWNQRFFDHDRMRAAVFRYGWRSFRSTYYQFVDHLAREAKRDFPEATALRVRFYKYRTASAEEVLTHREPEGQYIFTRQRALK